MHAALLFLLLLGAPFWETRQPRQWSDEELQEMLTDSPWAQTTTFRDAAPVVVYLAGAKPLLDAGAERQRRYSKTDTAPAATPASEYGIFLAQNRDKVIVLAIGNPNVTALSEEAEVKRMEEESVLKLGRKKVRMIGHFPPTPSDPVLRLVYPRPSEAVKDLDFELYIPGVTGPYRQAIFRWKDLVYQGKIEM